MLPCRVMFVKSICILIKYFLFLMFAIDLARQYLYMVDDSDSIHCIHRSISHNLIMSGKLHTTGIKNMDIDGIHL